MRKKRKDYEHDDLFFASVSFKFDSTSWLEPSTRIIHQTIDLDVTKKCPDDIQTSPDDDQGHSSPLKGRLTGSLKSRFY